MSLSGASEEGAEGGGLAARVSDDAAVAPLDAVERDELKQRVRAAVEELPERQRLAILLNKFHGLSYEELAETLEMTIPGIKSLLVRARENVRKRIDPYLKTGTDSDSAALEALRDKRGTS